MVGLDLGESECNDAAAERVETGKGACDDIDMVVGVVTQMFGLSPGSARSAGNGVGTAQVICVNGDMIKRGRGRTPARIDFVKCLVERLSEHRQTFHFGLLHGESRGNATIALMHLCELRSNFARELDAVLYRGIRFEGFTLNFFKEIRSGSQELAV